MPTLDLDWEVGAFRALRALWRWAVPAATVVTSASAVPLEPHQGRLEAIARCSAGLAVRVVPGRGAGGVRGLDLLFPPTIDVHADPEVNAGFFLLRALLGGELAKRLRSVPEEPEARLRVELLALADALRACGEVYSRFPAAWSEALSMELAGRPEPSTPYAAAVERLRLLVASGGVPSEADWASLPPRRRDEGSPRPFLLWGEIYASSLVDGSAGTDPVEQRTSADVTTEAEAPPVEDLRRTVLDPRGDDKTLQHAFEKVETADNWEGNALKADGSDELGDELEALEEVDLRDLVRGGPQAHAVLRADLGAGTGIPDVHQILPGERGIPYDEWDASLRSYRKGWCTVYPSPVLIGRPGAAASSLSRNRRRVDKLHHLLLRLRSARAWSNRQRDGDHPDIDALVARLADLRAGHASDDRLYLRATPRRRDFVTTVLLDVSLSADSWVQERHVLEVSRDAVLVLGEVAERLGDRFEVLAFASHTRNRCRVWSVKGYDEVWSSCRARLFAIDPQGYTRIGAAIRHASAQLLRQRADARLLLMIGDGKPTDYDRYEGAHGVADVRHAVHDAERSGLLVHALAVDPGARSTLPAMFGMGRWHAVADPDRLPDVLAEVYGRLTASV